MGHFRVKVYKEYFDFAAAHFITFLGRCETIHGHNYRVEVELDGQTGPDGFVYNFSDLKPLVRQLCSSLDHKMLLAAHNPHIKYKQQGEELEVTFAKRRYLFPLDEVAMLPINNTTAEELAQYLLKQLKAAIIAQNRPEQTTLTKIEVAVEEQPGQSAYYFEEW